MCGGRGRTQVSIYIGHRKEAIAAGTEEHREGDVKGCRLGLSLVKDYLVLPGL